MSTTLQNGLQNDLRHLHGPFDVVGDVHGCLDELLDLLRLLGYEQHSDLMRPPAGRTLVMLGDLVDRGPRSPETVWFVQRMIDAGHTLCVAGNHDTRLMEWLRGKKMPLTWGLADTVEQLDGVSHEARAEMAQFIDDLPRHLRLDKGRLVIAHAGLRESLHGAETREARDLAIYGEKTGKRDVFGDVRADWAAAYSGEALVVYGHTPVPEPRWLNNTVNVDTGCVFGGKLTALRYPERETVSVPCRKKYYEATRPFLPGDPRFETGRQFPELS